MSLYTLHTYQKNSYIILEGESKAEDFYIIKQGHVNLIKKFPVASEKHIENLGPGDFFGVVGAMSQLPQLETAVTTSPAHVISINHSKFADLVKNNPSLAIKIIRSFSKKLRIFNERTVDFRNPIEGEDENFRTLLNIANSYVELHRNRIATYMYRCIIYHVPDTRSGEEAREKLTSLESSHEFQKKTGVVQTFDDGEVIFCENEPPNEVYILKKGKVRISRIVDGKDIQLFVMKPGDVFGEMALLENKNRSATAVALEESEVLVINRANFEMMTQKEPQLMTKLIALLADRIWTSNKLMLNTYFPDLNAKILDMLFVNFERTKMQITPSQSYAFNLSFSDVMNMIILDEKIEKAESTFLAANKFMKIEKNNLVCIDMQQLSRQIGALRTKYLISKFNK
jgi:CRP-like cAMP-binding protein